MSGCRSSVRTNSSARASEPRRRRQVSSIPRGSLVGEPARNRRPASPATEARPDFLGYLIQRIAEVVERDRDEHDVKRVGLVAQRCGRGRENALAGCAAPELDDFDLLFARAFPRDMGAAAIRAALWRLSVCGTRFWTTGRRIFGCAEGHGYGTAGGNLARRRLGGARLVRGLPGACRGCGDGSALSRAKC